MVIRLTKRQIQLLKELKAAGWHGQRIAGTSSAEIAHLIGAHYVKRLPGLKKLYSITKHGRQALAGATSGKNDPD